MTVLISYPFQTKKENKIFFEKKDQELTSLDWAKWAGWYDTDGWFSTYETKTKIGTPFSMKETSLYLKDRQPVELFARTFETSLVYREHKTWTPEPYRYEYICIEHMGTLRGQKAIWFTKNVYPYLIKQEKKDYVAKLLGYRPESKDLADWTPDEVIHYLATATEGDGCFTCILGKKTIYLDIRIASSDMPYLSDIKYIMENKLGLRATLREKGTDETKKGIKTKYALTIGCSQKNPNTMTFVQSLAKDGVMTLDRKKQKVQGFINNEME